MVGLIQDGDEKHYREEVKLFVEWYSTNNLLLNVETVHARPAPHQGYCCGDCPTHKFLGVHVTDNLYCQKGIPAAARPAGAKESTAQPLSPHHLLQKHI